MFNEFWYGAKPSYAIERSIRFNSADSAFLSRTFSSAGNRKTWTWSGWVKRSAISASRQAIFVCANAGATLYTGLEFNASEGLTVYDTNAAGGVARATTAVYRDAAAWYHVLLAYDTTSATADDRIKLYVNGSQVTVFTTKVNPAQNADTYLNSAVAHSIGSWSPGATLFLNGYLADIHFIDGQALTPSSFGEFDTNGVWQPKAFSGGSYGTNGFKLDFSDNSSNTATTLGKDTSGNGNNWTPNSLSVTAGAGNDSLVDSPTNYGIDTGVGGEVRGNYCTLNPIHPLACTLANGNLECTTPVSGSTFGFGNFNIPTSGKWYWEYTALTNGFYSFSGIIDALDITKYVVYWAANGQKYIDGAASAYGAAHTTNDIIGVAVNSDAGTITFYKNNVSQGAISYSSLSNGRYVPLLGDGTSDVGVNFVVNFGQRPFSYQAPADHKCLCSTNLPTPIITKGSSAMDVKLYTGNGGTNSITGLGFSPDLIWIKARGVAYNHRLIDSVRGVQKFLLSNTTNAEITSTLNDRFNSFDSTGFTLGSADDSGADGLNQNTVSYAAWAWDAGSSTVTNTSGSISSQVRANPSAGFSVATFTTPASGTFTVGHGLNVAPSLVILKSRASAFSWLVYHKEAGPSKYLYLNSTIAATTNTTVWQNTNPSSTVVYGNTSNWGTNDSQVMYAFSPVEGYSAFGSYVGNGSTNGPFIYTGFRPRWVMIKNATTAGTNWVLHDSARSPGNASNEELYPNLANAEQTPYPMDFLSNGFKIRDTSFGNTNGSGATIVWVAFAEHPFRTSRAR